MRIYRKYFGKKLREAMDAAGIKGVDLAEKVGVEPPSVSRWINGLDFPDDARLPKIARTVKVSTDYFDVCEAQTKLDFNDAGAFLSKYASLSPKLRKIVWAIVFEDPELYESHPELKQTLK